MQNQELQTVEYNYKCMKSVPMVVCIDYNDCIGEPKLMKVPTSVFEKIRDIARENSVKCVLQGEKGRTIVIDSISVQEL